MTHRKLLLSTFLRFGMLLAMVLPVAPTVAVSTAVAAEPAAPRAVAPAAPLATTNTIALSVVSARTEPWWGAPLGEPNPPGINEGDPITQYRFIINEDNTGDPWQARYPDCSRYTDATLTEVNTAYPADCNWPSIAAVPSSSPIVTQGDDSILSKSTTLILPDGKYLISVIADGFRIDGQWFTLPMEESAPGSGVAMVDVPMSAAPAAPNSHGAVPSSGIVCTTNPSATFTLTAREGFASMTDGNVIYMWSYAEGTDDFQFPGPVLCVNEGDRVTIVLHNTLPQDTSLVFPGQENVLANGLPSQPQFDGLGAMTSMAQVAASGGSATYSFVATKPGTFLYQSGTNPGIQVQMGLYGAIVVRPALGANYVYNDPPTNAANSTTSLTTTPCSSWWAGAWS